jgi:hypothetical protein
VPGWAWLLGLLLLIGGAVAVVVGRRRTTQVPVATATIAPAVGTTVLPSRGAAARTSPSVVVSTPGRRVDVVVDDPSPVESAAPVGAQPDTDASTALDATGPVPLAPLPVAAAGAAAPVAETAVPAVVDHEPQRPAGPRGGNVRVIRPPATGS